MDTTTGQGIAGSVEVGTYEDFTGRTQWRACGERGTFLVTRKGDRDFWEVWKSDELRGRGRYRDLAAALDRASRLAGLDAVS